MPRPGAPAPEADRRNRFRAWQDRIRDPSLTALFVLAIVAIFVAAPVAARGWVPARIVGDALVLPAAAIVVLLSRRVGATVAVLLGVVDIFADQILGGQWSPVAVGVARRCGEIVAWSAVIWVLVHAIYGSGRITAQRLQGAAVVYLSIACLFAAAFGLIWAVAPDAFANLHGAPTSDQATAELLYFSLTTLTTVGYGDILAVDPLARSLANLESVIGVFYIAITVTRLVTLELADRRP
jgi:hypothetical protein